MRQQLTRKTREWLCVSDRGYTSHIVVVRGYTCLYTAYVLKRCENHIVTVMTSQLMGKPKTAVNCGYTPQVMVLSPSLWLKVSIFSSCVSSLPGKHGSGYVSLTVVIRLISWLCVVIRGYKPHVYQ